METSNRDLLDDLTRRTAHVLAEATRYKSLPAEVLNRKPDTVSWSVLECLEHLNLYGDFYLPEMENVIAKGGNKSGGRFKSGWLGNYFAESMLPKNGKLKKMKTFADKNPSGSKLTTDVLDRFIKQQNKMLELLKMAENVDLTRLKTHITITGLIRLRLGDTLRFVVHHNERHLMQAERVLAGQPSLELKN